MLPAAVPKSRIVDDMHASRPIAYLPAHIRALRWSDQGRAKCGRHALYGLTCFRIIGTLPLPRLFRKFDPTLGHFQK